MASTPAGSVASATEDASRLARVGYVIAIGLTLALVWNSASGALFGDEQYELGRDFATFHAAAELVTQGDAAAMYDPDVLGARVAETAGYADGRSQSYGHPPFFAMAFLPLVPLPFLAAFFVFSAGGLAALWVTMSRVGLKRVGAALGLVLLSYPGYSTARVGQMGFWVAAVMLGIFLALRSNRRFAAGVLLGLLAFKPLYAVGIGIWWLLRPRHHAKALAGAFTSATALALAGLAVPAGWANYRMLLGDSGGSFVGDVARSGFSPLEMWLAILPGSSSAAVLWLATAAGVTGAFAVGLRRCRHRLDISLSMGIVVGLLIVPRTGWYDWVLLVVPGVLLWMGYPNLRPRLFVAGGWLFFAAAASWPLALRMENGIGTFVQFAPLALVGVAWWWFDHALRERRDSRTAPAR